MDHTQRPSRIAWLDAAKCAAILAVLLNHTVGILYNNKWLLTSSIYCVALFVLISGMTSYLSNQRHQRTWLAEFLHSSKTIIPAYLLATLVFQIARAAKQHTVLFDFATYLRYLGHFNATVLFYYVCLYLQLMLLSRFLYRCIEGFPERFRLLYEITGGLVLLVFAAFSISCTNILDIYGGGGKLFGGTYLFLFYLGMLLMKHRIFEPVSPKRCLVFLAVVTPLLAGWYVMIHLTDRSIDAFFPFGEGYNPPSVAISILALLVLFFVYGAFPLLQTVPVLRWGADAAAYIGRHTLYIFLFHRFLLDYVLEAVLATVSPFPGMRLLIFCALAALPIGWEYIVRTVVRFFRRLQRLDA